jgi:threonyl-tRNA synthetase
VDFEDQKITDADFKIEDRVLEISRGKHEFKLRPVSKTEALELYKDNVYKTEMITNLEDGTITFCDHDTLLIYVVVVIFRYWNNQSMKIMSVGAGVVTKKKQTVDSCMELHSLNKRFTEYLLLLGRGKRRDHRKLGKKN